MFDRLCRHGVKPWHVAAMSILLGALTATACPGAARADAEKTTLYVTVSNVTNAQGHIRLAVCTRNTFLGKNCPYVVSAPARIGSVTLRVEGVEPGVYAVQAFHDEDDSGDIRLSLLGIPEEGVGFSNDAPIRIGAPSFSRAAFQLVPGSAQVSFRLVHFD
jgi:uncharacterized protein (DUF2141 family)